MSKPKLSTVDASYLAKIGEEAFPDVMEPCVQCGGSGKGYQNVHGTAERCEWCRGEGRKTRPMDAREEHFWIIHLIDEFQRKYQLR